MPALEMAQETGKLLAWRKKEGEQVTKGEPLLEIETDKAVVEVEAPADGVLSAVSANTGDEIPVGKTIAWLLKPGESVPSGTSASNALTPRGASLQGMPSSFTPTDTPSHAVAAPRISPKARRLAKELGVEVERITGTGPGGVVSAEDVKAHANRPPSNPGPLPGSPAIAADPLSAVARLMAERTTRSWTSVPHFFVSRGVDCTALQAFHKEQAAQFEESDGGKLTITDILIAITARVLAEHPRLNASWDNGAMLPNADVNISIAMAVRDGVVNAVIHGAQKESLAGIAARRQQLTGLARGNKLRPTDIRGGTFSISNLGMYKVDAFTAIIPSPQVAILAVGNIADRVVALDGQPVVRSVMTMTLSSDHRVIDGARAGEFLRDLTNALQEPGKWL
jgi:pyruvate dehydrogenase E2 component (dihydrolipoamide acetyltransferase)